MRDGGRRTATPFDARRARHAHARRWTASSSRGAIRADRALRDTPAGAADVRPCGRERAAAPRRGHRRVPAQAGRASAAQTAATPSRGAASSSAAAAARHAAAAARRRAAAAVLLVEDNPVNQQRRRGMLERLGCRVEVAAQRRARRSTRLRERAFDAHPHGLPDAGDGRLRGDARASARARAGDRRTPIVAHDRAAP